MLYTIALLLLMASWLQPMHILPWVSWHSEILSFLSMFAFGVHLLLLPSKLPHSLKIPNVGLALVSLVFILIAQATFGLIAFLGDVFVIAAYLALCIVGVAAGYRIQQDVRAEDQLTVNHEKYLVQFAVVCLFVACSSATIGIAQAFDVWWSSGWFERTSELRRPGANLGQPNHLATLLIMGIASLAYIFELKRLSILGTTVIFTLLAIGLAATASRSGLLSFWLIALWWLFGSHRAMRRASLSACACGGTLMGVFVLSWPSIVIAVQEGTWAIDPVQNHINVSGHSRFAIWEQLIFAVSQRPWFGWGIREVAAAHNAVVDGYAQSAPFTYSHSLILDLAVGFGLPTATALVCLGAWWLVKRVRAVRTTTAWFSLALTLPFFIHSQFEFPFAYAYFLLPVSFAIGTLEGSINASAFCVSRRWAALFFVSFFGMFGWSVYEYSVLEEDFRVARFEALRIGNTPAEYEKPKVYLLTQLGALVWASRFTPTTEMSEEDIGVLRKVALHFPWTATQNRYALALALNGNFKEATRQLRVMHTMHGERTYQLLMESWDELSKSKYPQLQRLEILTHANRAN